jgi:hypothetical protein
MDAKDKYLPNRINFSRLRGRFPFFAVNPGMLNVSYPRPGRRPAPVCTAVRTPYCPTTLTPMRTSSKSSEYTAATLQWLHCSLRTSSKFAEDRSKDYTAVVLQVQGSLRTSSKFAEDRSKDYTAVVLQCKGSLRTSSKF